MEIKASLFERIGGMNAVNAAVDIFYQKVLADDGINHFFYQHQYDRTIGQDESLFSDGIWCTHGRLYRNENEEAHAHMNLTNVHFDAVAGQLIATLQELGVAQDLIDEVVGIALSTKNDVLGQ